MAFPLAGMTGALLGHRLDEVFDIQEGDGPQVGLSLSDGKAFTFMGAQLPVSRVTIYDLLVVEVQASGMIHASLDEKTRWFEATASSDVLSPLILEVFAGCGGMGIGASFVGGVPVVSVDHNHLSVAHLEANQRFFLNPLWKLW